MNRATSRPRKTKADFMALGEEMMSELIDGELYTKPSNTIYHQQIVGELMFIIRPHVKEHDLGFFCGLPLDVHLPSGDIVKPDLQFICKARESIIKDWVFGAPDLAIEVLSHVNAERDRIVKRDLYAQNGVAEYWIVDPDAKAIEVLRLRDAGYEPAGYFTEAGVLTTETLPGLQLVVDEVFA